MSATTTFAPMVLMPDGSWYDMPRVWVCGVVRSGYHNGAGCRPEEPHDGWDCCFRWEASIRCEAPS